MRTLIIAALTIGLTACGQKPDYQDHAPVVNNNNNQPTVYVNFQEGGSVDTTVFRDETGCEWLVFRYRGYGVSTQPRMETYAQGTQHRQVCN